jgi:hypothetical protein
MFNHLSGASIGAIAGGVELLQPLNLSASTIQEGAAAGTLVGAIQNGKASGSTITLEAQSNASWFALDGTDIEAGATATDYETAAAPTITLRETNAGFSNSPFDTIITLTVTNVLEVTLGALNLNDLSHSPSDTQGTLVGSITGASSGSTVTLLSQEVANAYQKDGNDIEIGSAGPLSAGERDITLRETHPDASNSPNDTVITITSEAVEVLGDELHQQPTFDASTNMTLNGWSIAGGQANSNGGTGFLSCTATATLDTGDYRYSLDVASVGGQCQPQLLIAATNAGLAVIAGAGVVTGRFTVSSVTDQIIRIRETDEVGIVLNGLSVKKVVSG